MLEFLRARLLQRRPAMTALASIAQPTPTIQYRRWQYEGPRRAFPESAHPTFEISWVREGRVRYEVGRRSTQVGPHMVALLAPEVDHVTTFENTTDAEAFQLEPERVFGIAKATGVDVSAAIGGAAFRDDRKLGQLVALLRDEVSNQRPGCAQMIDALAEAMVIEMLRGSSAQRSVSKDPRIARAIECVHSRFAEPIGVADLARAAAMSRYHFSRCFRAQTGMSPYRYIQHVRVHRAKHLLSDGNAVSRVAHEVGFADLGRFAKAFQRELGCSPSQWQAH